MISHLADRTVGIVIIPLDVIPEDYHGKVLDFIKNIAENTLIHAEHKFILVVADKGSFDTLKDRFKTPPYPPVPVVFWDVPTLRKDNIGALLAGVEFTDQREHGAAVLGSAFEQALKLHERMRRALMKAAIRRVLKGDKISIGERENEGADESPEHREMKYVIAYLISEGVHLDRGDGSEDKEKARVKGVTIEGSVDGNVFADVVVNIDGTEFYYEYETMFDGGILNVFATLEKYKGREDRVRIILHPLDAYIHRGWIKTLKKRFEGVKFGTIIVKVTDKEKTAHMVPVEEFWKLLKDRKGPVSRKDDG